MKKDEGTKRDRESQIVNDSDEEDDDEEDDDGDLLEEEEVKSERLLYNLQALWSRNWGPYSHCQSQRACNFLKFPSKESWLKSEDSESRSE